tara:strand:- start:7348 stop:7968 length:621 start_codon:yes stop_codon:yes gene_type:complete
MDLNENTFIFLDNGSTSDFISSYDLGEKRGIKIVKSPNNLGFGGGISFASKFVEKEFIAWMPGNLKINPKDVYEILQQQNLSNKYIYIKGRRGGRPFIDALKTRIFGVLVSIFFNKYIYDAGGTPNLIHRDFFSITKDFPKDFTFDIFVYYYCLINKLTIKRPKIKYTTRLYGQSHWQKGILSEIKLTLDVFKYKQEWKEISKIKF